jgi:hypothetical protein
MTVFIHEPDGADEPTIWVLEGGNTDKYQYTHLFSRVDLDPDARRFWPDVVARMTGTTIHADVDRDALARTARDAFANGWRTASPGSTAWPQVVDAILAALTGVPHD